MGCLDKGLKVRTLSMPDAFVDQDKPALQNEKAGLDALSIAKKAMTALGFEESDIAALA